MFGPTGAFAGQHLRKFANVDLAMATVAGSLRPALRQRRMDELHKAWMQLRDLALLTRIGARRCWSTYLMTHGLGCLQLLEHHVVGLNPHAGVQCARLHLSATLVVG